jgi:hypothetical protein
VKEKNANFLAKTFGENNFEIITSAPEGSFLKLVSAYRNFCSYRKVGALATLGSAQFKPTRCVGASWRLCTRELAPMYARAGANARAEASFLKESLCLRGELAPTQQWCSAQLAPTREVGS